MFCLAGERQVDTRSNPGVNTVEARFRMKGGPRTKEGIVIPDKGHGDREWKQWNGRIS